MTAPLHLHYDVDGSDFTNAGVASVLVKKALNKAGLDSDIIRRVTIAIYEGEINLVIHGGGGTVDVDAGDGLITITLEDHGPGIENVALAMQEGFSTASDAILALGFGAGMGLPNMKRYTDSLVVDTAVGSGTKITMTVKY